MSDLLLKVVIENLQKQLFRIKRYTAQNHITGCRLFTLQTAVCFMHKFFGDITALCQITALTLEKIRFVLYNIKYA